MPARATAGYDYGVVRLSVIMCSISMRSFNVWLSIFQIWVWWGMRIQKKKRKEKKRKEKKRNKDKKDMVLIEHAD